MDNKELHLTHSNSELDSLIGNQVCSICGSSKVWQFFELLNVPLQDGVVWATKSEALNAPKGDIKLTFCQTCAYISNQTHDLSKASFTNYDFSLHYSPLYQNFIDSLINSIISRYHIREKTVIDIGCWQGDFLKRICDVGNNRGIGIDPSYADNPNHHEKTDRLTFIQDYYSDKYTQYKADLICCRHILDILEQPKKFLTMLRSMLGDDSNSILYVEVPNGLHTFSNLVVWNLIYEKKSWFFPESLIYIFETCGFEVINVAPCFGNEYLGIEVKVAQNFINKSRVTEESMNTVYNHLKQFFEESRQLTETWRNNFDNIKKSGQRVVAWGAGARAVTFLNIYQLQDVIPFIVDINPNRQGMYLPGTAHRIEAPEYLQIYKPEIILITNPTYEQEIKLHVQKLGLTCDFLVL
ncbi:methyltransferase domain-containing protein [Nostoc punctiforme UO1]|uniref:methyltransferase domain-containing protein n=1 Tax=Nostoc punctiforme TaxID=272131 RepID=UPI0030A23D05